MENHGKSQMMTGGTPMTWETPLDEAQEGQAGRPGGLFGGSTNGGTPKWLMVYKCL